MALVPITVKDAAGTNRTFLVDDSPGSSQFVNALVLTLGGTLVATGNPLPVTAAVTSLPALAAGTNNIGDVDVLTLPALPAGTNNIGDVDVLTLPALPAGPNFIGKVGNLVTNPSASFTIASLSAAAYAIGDLVANHATAGSVVPMTFTVANSAGSVAIGRVWMTSSRTSLPAAGTGSYRLHLYRASPTAINGDNAAFSTSMANYLGAYDVTLDRLFSDGCYGATGNPVVGSEMLIKLASGTDIFGLVESRTANTPYHTSTYEVHTWGMELIQLS